MMLMWVKGEATTRDSRHRAPAYGRGEGWQKGLAEGEPPKWMMGGDAMVTT
jgi:hypothetical protein